MTQQQLDYLCINQQTSIGQRASRLVDLASSGDISSPAFTACLMASFSLMMAIKDFDITTGELTDEELFAAQNKLLQLENTQETNN